MAHTTRPVFLTMPELGILLAIMLSVGFMAGEFWGFKQGVRIAERVLAAHVEITDAHE